MQIKLPFIIALLVVASSCSTVKKTSHSAVDDRVNNIVWGVISYKGHSLNESDFPNGLPRISFDMQYGKISGMDGCNSFMGLATYKGNIIKTGAIASTKTQCPASATLSDFYDIFASGNLTWQLDNTNTLRLMVNGLEVMALKERQ